MRKWIGCLMAAFWGALPRPALATYTFTGPVIARTSGVTCRGDAFYNPFLVRTDAGTLVSGYAGGSVIVFCPINRRNVSPIFVNSNGDVINISRVEIFVNQVTSDSLSCTVTMGGNLNSAGLPTSAYYSETRWACGTAGGCTDPPNSEPPAESTTLDFPWPFGQAAVVDQTISNIVVMCDTPNGSSIVGSVAQFDTF